LAVNLEFDFRVEAGFYYLGRWPIALMDAIGQRKAEMFDALRRNPLVPDDFVACGSFVVQSREFHVIFGADQRRLSQHILRVMHIEP
jgi:hypothetical protein